MNIDKYTLEELKGVLKDNPKLPPEAKSVIEKAIEMKSKSAPKKATTTKKTTTAKPKATAKKTTTRKKTTTAKPKPTAEEKAQKKQALDKATRKTIEDCEKILAEYKANRMAQKEQNKDRLDKLEKKGNLIEGTDEKTLEATTETVNKEVKPKIEKEVKAIVDTAEKEAKKEVSEKGKTKEQVEKEVKAKAEKIITKKVDDMTKDLAKVSANYIKNIRDEIASIGDKKKAQEFLLELKKEIDVLLKAYGYGGAVQSYDIAWAGGGRPMPMFEKGGKFADGKKPNVITDGLESSNVVKIQVSKGRQLENITDLENVNFDHTFVYDTDNNNKVLFSGKYNKRALDILYEIEEKSKGGKFADGGEIKLSEKGSKLASLFEKSNELRKEYLRGYSKGDLMKFAYGSSMRNVDTALPLGALESYGIDADQRYRYVMDYNDKSFGEIVDLYDKIAERNPKVEIYNTDYEIVDTLPINEAYSKYYKNNDFPYMLDAFGEDKYSKGGKFADGGEVGDYKLEKIVMHYDGRDWMLDEYPSFIDNGDSDDWLGMSEIDLEKAKELAFELGGDEAYDVMEEINEAETIEELQDAISDLKYYQRDNTYNQSWWGGVIDFGVLTEDGEGYGTGLLILRMHRGGDPRGNYYDYVVYELDSFIEEFPPYYARLTYQIEDKDGNYATFDTEDMEGYTLNVVEDNITDLEEGDSITIDELEEKFGVDVYAKGGKVKKTTKLGWKRDRERLSKEPHEQAYKPKRKGKYSSFESGGELSYKSKTSEERNKMRRKRQQNAFKMQLSQLKNGQRKTIDQYFVQGNYGQGWEDLTTHDLKVDAMEEKKVYDKNESYPHRVVTKRITKENYLSGNYAKGGSIDEVRIYVADLEAYNNGQLKGGWLDLADYSDGSEVMEAIDELIDGEEYAIHDYEGFPSNMYSEYMGEEDFNQIIEIYNAQDEIGIPMDVILEFMSDRGIDDISTVQDAYYGEYDSFLDYAIEMVDEGIYVPSSFDIYMTDTDRRIVAGEEADYFVDNLSEEEAIDDYGDRDAYDEAEEEEDYDKMEELVDEAKEEAREKVYDNTYEALNDPVDYFVNELGSYTEEELLTQGFISIDYEKVASELEYDNYSIRSKDGQVYVFSNNYAKGGKLKKKPYNRSYHMDRKRLSKEKHEQAYLPKRKKSYFAKGGKLSKDDAIIKALKMGVDFDKDFHAQSYGNELSQLAKEVGYRKSKSSSGSLGRAFFEHLEKIYDKNSSYYKSMV